MAGKFWASWAIGGARNGCITKDTPPPFDLPSTTSGYTPRLIDGYEACSTPEGVIVWIARFARAIPRWSFRAQSPKASSSGSLRELRSAAPAPDVLNARRRHRLDRGQVAWQVSRSVVCSTPEGVIVWIAPDSCWVR